MLVHSDAGFWELAPPGSNGDVALRTEGVLLRVLSGFRRSHASKPLSAVARPMGFQHSIAAMRFALLQHSDSVIKANWGTCHLHHM